jgi:hypothetical protein
MLIDVFAGRDRRSAEPKGSFHFSRSPTPGEQVEIEGEVLIVTRAWHRPNICYPGAKFAVLVEQELADAELVVPCLDDTAV